MMGNYVSLGPLHVRVSRKHLAPWGYALVRLGGLDLFSRSNTGDLMLATYHPKKSLTWHWGISLRKGRGKRLVSRDTMRRSQWHDYYALPFGYELVVGRQDYHKRARTQPEEK